MVIASYWLAHFRLVRTLAAIDQLTILANLVLIAAPLGGLFDVQLTRLFAAETI